MSGAATGSRWTRGVRTAGVSAHQGQDTGLAPEANDPPGCDQHEGHERHVACTLANLVPVGHGCCQVTEWITTSHAGFWIGTVMRNVRTGTIHFTFAQFPSMSAETVAGAFTPPYSFKNR
jgi:hypothetical protein